MQDIQSSCPYDNSDTDERYLAGTLSPPDTDAFESHYFQCDRCWELVHRGSEIKAALSVTPIVAIDSARLRAKTSARGRIVRWAAPLAAAAAVLLVAFGNNWNYKLTSGLIRPDRGPGDTAQVMRGEAKNITVSSHQAGSMLIAAWAPAQSATSYRVRLLAADGALLYERETADTSIVLTEDSAGVSRKTAYWEIQALNELRSVIAASALTPTVPQGARR